MLRTVLLLGFLTLPLSAVDITITSIQLHGTWSANVQPVIDVNRQAVVMGENRTWTSPVITVTNNRVDATIKARCGNASTVRKVNLVLPVPRTRALEGVGKVSATQGPVCVAKGDKVDKIDKIETVSPN